MSNVGSSVVAGAVRLVPDLAPRLGAGLLGVAARHDVGDDARIAGRVGAGDDDVLADVREPADDGLDLAELDAVAAHLHLVVEAAAELQLAVGQQRHEVAGAVHPGAAGRRQVDEALGGQLRAVEVAAHDAVAADQQLAGRPDRVQLQVAVDDVHLGVGDRAADRDRLAGGLDRRHGRPDRRLRRPVHVEQPAAHRRADLVDERRRQRLAAEQQLLERGERAEPGRDRRR